MASRREPLYGDDARRVEDLLGLDLYSLRAVERRANGDFALMFRAQKLGDRFPRALRIPAKRVFGYQQRSPLARSSDVAHRRRHSARRFAWWLGERVGFDAPVVVRAMRGGDYDAIDELRTAIVVLTPPDYVIAVWEAPRSRARPYVPDFVPGDWT